MQASFPNLAVMRFVDAQHAWIWVLLIGLGTWVLFRTYRQIFRRSRRQLTWVLMALRGVGLLALLLVLIKPVIERRVVDVDPGHLAVVLDDSVSMSLADDTGLSRYERARTAVGAIRSGMAKRAGNTEVTVVVHDIHGEPVEGDGPEHPAAERTEIEEALRKTVGRLRSQHLLGVVLISDGADNAGRASGASPADTGVPVYTMGFRPDPAQDRMDVRVSVVRGPDRAIVHNTVNVDVHLEKAGGPDAGVTVRLLRGSEDHAVETAHLPAGDAEQVVRLSLTPEATGRFIYTAVVSTPAGDRLPANNRISFPVVVHEEPIRVLYLEGFLRYEYKYVKRRLEDDADVSVVSIVRRANPDRINVSPRGDLLTPDHLDRFDIVILGDMEGSYLDTSEYSTVAEWVDGGHALLILGGYNSFGSEGFRDTSLAEILPVVFKDSEPAQSEAPFTLMPTVEGIQHPLFEISGDRVKDEALWAGAPPLTGSSLVQSVKPGATILAVRTDLQTASGPMPVIAVHRYGEGRVMALMADTTWRWTRFARILGRSDTLFARFWSQTVRWLGHRDTETSSPPLQLVTDDSSYDVGRPVAITLTHRPSEANAVGEYELRCTLRSEDGVETPITLRSEPAAPHTFHGTVYPSQGGRYGLDAALLVDGKVAANEATEFLVHGAALELADTGVDRRRLRALAVTTGGLSFDVDDVDGLVEAIQPEDRRTVRIIRTDLWNSPWLFIAFLGAITTEWILRRRNHLV